MLDSVSVYTLYQPILKFRNQNGNGRGKKKWYRKIYC